MKVLIFNGSPRSKGATSTVLHRIETELKERDVEVDFYDLGNIEMSHCTGCCSCYRTGACYLSERKVLDNLVLYSGGKIGDHILLKIPFNGISGMEKAITRKTFRASERLIWEIKGKKKHPVQCFCHRIIFRLGIRPFVREKGDAYAGVVRKWKERGII